MSRPTRETGLVRFAHWSEHVATSPVTPVATLIVIGLALYALPPVGIPPERIALVHMLIGVVTLLLVFLLEHNEHRDVTAMQLKLDEIIQALGADRGKIGIEDFPSEKLEDIRDEDREDRTNATRAADRA